MAVNCSCSRSAIGSPLSFSKVIPAAWKPVVGTVSPKTMAKKSYGAPWKYLMPSSWNCSTMAGLYSPLIQSCAVSGISWYSGSAFGGKK